jgi:lipopolysaccharide/colanic/teichoic acid biosynthesis glycosyltransferase
MSRGVASALKRGFDVTVGTAALLALAPLSMLIALAIKLDDAGPIFFVQDRIGRHGRVFRCLKFRTMVLGAETTAPGPAATPDDSRITRVGRILRLWTLDEIPQLLNVLAGDMSIVGPRAWIPSEAARCTDRDRRRFDVRPGMAGWAWIHGRNLLPWDERIRLDLWYVDHWSLWLDISILLRAFVLLFRRTGVYHGDTVAAETRDPLRSRSSDAQQNG